MFGKGRNTQYAFDKRLDVIGGQWSNKTQQIEDQGSRDASGSIFEYDVV